MTERKALDQGMDVLPLNVRLANARRDLKEARRALGARGTGLHHRDEAKVEAAGAPCGRLRRGCDRRAGARSG